MKIEEESQDRVSKALKPTDGKPTGEEKAGPEAGAAPQEDPCKVFSLDEYRSKRKTNTATEA